VIEFLLEFFRMFGDFSSAGHKDAGMTF
jgi:hypothetical protein